MTVKDYSLFADDVASATSTGKSVWLDASKVSFAIFNAAKQASVPSEGMCTHAHWCFGVEGDCKVSFASLTRPSRPLCHLKVWYVHAGE